MSRKGKGSQFRRHKERQHRHSREKKTEAFDDLAVPFFKEPMKHYVPPAYIEFGNILTSVAEARKKPHGRPKHVSLAVANEIYKSRQPKEA